MRWVLVAAIVLALHSAAGAGTFFCDLSTPCAGWFCSERQASVLAESAGVDDDIDAIWTVTLTDTHVDPVTMDQQPGKTRVIEGTRSANAVRAGWTGDFAVIFSDAETLGVLSIGYSRRAYMSLHIDGADYDYAEAYSGFCEVVG